MNITKKTWMIIGAVLITLLLATTITFVAMFNWRPTVDNDLTPTATPTASMTPSVTVLPTLTATPTATPVAKSEFVLFSLDVSKPMWEKNYKYPSELRTNAPSSKIGTCSPVYEHDSGTYKERYVEDGKTPGIMSETYLLNFIQKQGETDLIIELMSGCVTSTGEYYIAYNTALPQSIDWNISKVKADGTVITSVRTQQNGFMLNCSNIVAIDSSGNVYYSCGTGDAGSVIMTMRRYNFNTKKGKTIVSCTSQVEIGDDNPPPAVTKCTYK